MTTTNVQVSMTLLPTLFLCIAIAQSNYTLPHQYFINCGFTGTTTVNGRAHFVGDKTKSANFSLSAYRSTALTNPATNSGDVYGTARVFRRQSSYELHIAQDGTYVVRFHFSAFVSKGFDLYRARFNVSASKYYLLSNFTVERNSTGSGSVREFLFNVTVGKLTITFTPSSGSLAFVNAIEAFLAPDDLISDEAIRASDPAGSDSVKGLWSRALQVIHRINVGGDKVEAQADDLLKTWDSDEPYVSVPGAAGDQSLPGGQPDYGGGVSTKYDAPAYVYSTAKVLKNGSSSVSWEFKVNRKSCFRVRAYFCDFISSSGSEIMKFDLHIYTFTQQVDRNNVSGASLGVPFYLEYAVDSDDSGIMNISISPSQDSDNKTAFLNALEIMLLINSSSSLPVAVDVAETSKNRLVIITGSVIGGMLLIIASALLLLWCFCLRARRKGKTVQSLEDWQRLKIKRRGSSRSGESNGSQLCDLNLGLKMGLGEVLFATKNFDEELVIGRGGFGKVYRGILMDGTKVAVKRSEPDTSQGQGLSEFQTEIMVLSKIRHRHLVSLIGYCEERAEMVLVYEYMEKGTLRDHLYSPNNGGSYSNSNLSWEKRLELCIDAARGIHYLHTGLGRAVIHRDIKSTNILLDEHYVAKVADFGISMLSAIDQSHVVTDVKGTFGYLDPEYFSSASLTHKSDVYSFGVVLLEVLSARAPIHNHLPREQVNLADWGVYCIAQGKLHELVDPFLAAKIAPDSLRRFGQIVQKCLQDYGDDRPNMVDLLWDLEYTLKLQQSAHPPENSCNSDFLYLGLPGVARLPSQSFCDDESDLDVSDTHRLRGSNSCVSDVFSDILVQEPR